jgi:hypothetical protein
MQAPLIDKRSYDDLVAQTSELAKLSGWRPRPDGQPDAGQALIGVFGRFTQLVIERLNRAPDQNYLAFLNLIGAALTPPRVARVPLTFHLATGSPVDATVPAGTLAAAPPLAGETGEVVFETERSLVVTRAQLQAVFVSDTEGDTYSDRTTAATTAGGEPFAVFAGDQPSPHQLFLAADPLLTGPGTKDITIALTTPDTWQWMNWPVSWAYWDGASWQPVTTTATVTGGRWQVTVPALPALPPGPVSQIQAGWLRAQLDLPLPPGAAGHRPESVAVGARPPQDLTLPWSPFPAESPIARFYLSAEQAFSAAGAQVTVQVELSTPGHAGTAVQLDWAYQAGDQWLPLGQSSSGGAQASPAGSDFLDGTQAFTRSGQITFHVPMSWPLSMYRTRTGRWLRVSVTSGQYTTPPEAAGLSVDYGWALPQVGAVTVASQPGAPPAPGPAPAAYWNQTGLDLSKDFYPLGQQPQFNDTFYVACPDSLAAPGAQLTLSVTMTNPPSVTSPPVTVVSTGGHPVVTWEVWDGSQWQATSANYSFTSNGQVQLTLPATARPVTVNGEQRFWLRGRLTAGNYGTAGSYTQNQDGSYKYTAASFAAPVVKSITVTSAVQPQPPAPVTACLSYNDFGYTDQLAGATGKGPRFTPFVPTADSDPALYLGFDQPFSQQAEMVFLDVQPPLPEQVGADQIAGAEPAADPRLTWEYSGPAGWQPLGALDETVALSRPDLVSFVGPADLIPRSAFGRELCWLRLRWPEGSFPLPPQLRRVLLNTTWAAQVTTVAGEILGSGNGDAGQSFTAAQTPVQPGQQVVVREPQLPVPAEEQALTEAEGADAVSVILDGSGQVQEIWVRWHAVPDFYQSGPRDRHYTVDPLSGAVQFGDGSYGLIPPIGPGNIRMTYRTGGGAAGNRAAATVVQLKSSVPYVDGVTNNERAQGGANTELISRLQARGPRVLRHRDRAVAAEDLEDLAMAASAEVAIAVAIGPDFNPFSLWLDPGTAAPPNDAVPPDAGTAGVIIVPAEPDQVRPTPSLVLLGEVSDYLRARCPATASLWVAGPEWISVSVTATVVVTTPEAADPAGAAARAALNGYLHPLTGGPDGQGWPFGRWPRASELSALLEAVLGVDHVGSLTVSYLPETSDPVRQADLQGLLEQPITEASDQPGRETDLWAWLDRALVCSGSHQVSVALG